MKPYKERIKKYERKLKSDIFKNYPKEEMVEKYSRFSKDIIKIEELVKEILDRNNINNGQIFYYAFAYELYKLTKKYKSEILKKEIKISYKKWLARGLKRKVLLELKNKVLEGYCLPQASPEAFPLPPPNRY